MFRDLLFPVVLPVVGAFLITVVLAPVIIPYLRKLKFGQTVRDDGPQSHLKKNGTPTMGGILFLISITLMTLPFIKVYPNVVPVLFLTLGFGLIGFLDDYIKVVLKRSMGLFINMLNRQALLHFRLPLGIEPFMRYYYRVSDNPLAN